MGLQLSVRHGQNRAQAVPPGARRNVTRALWRGGRGCVLPGGLGPSTTRASSPKMAGGYTITRDLRAREDKGSEPRVPRLRRLGGRLAVERVHLVASSESSRRFRDDAAPTLSSSGSGGLYLSR